MNCFTDKCRGAKFICYQIKSSDMVTCAIYCETGTLTVFQQRKNPHHYFTHVCCCTDGRTNNLPFVCQQNTRILRNCFTNMSPEQCVLTDSNLNQTTVVSQLMHTHTLWLNHVTVPHGHEAQFTMNLIQVITE